MALNFPSDPVEGDIYITGENKWTYDGFRWALEQTITISDIDDIDLTNAQDGDKLIYNAETQKLEAKFDTSSIAFAIALS